MFPMPVYGGGGGGGRKSNALLIIGLLCCCCIILPLIIYGILWGTNTICDKTNPEDQPWLGMNCASVYEGSSSPAPATGTPAPAPATDPRSTVWTTGQKLQGDPLEIGTAVVRLTTQPTLPSTATYSISMDLNIEKVGPRWRSILSSKNVTNWVNGQPVANTRRPDIYISGTDDSVGANKMHINHQGATLPGQQAATVTTPEFPLAKWTNFTVTVDAASKKVIMYINGVNVSETTFPEAPAWANPATDWYWNNDADPTSRNGSVKVANAYFFTSVLTAAQVSQLKVPSAPTLGVATTSYYTAQPLIMGTSAYVKETYTPEPFSMGSSGYVKKELTEY